MCRHFVQPKLKLSGYFGWKMSNDLFQHYLILTCSQTDFADLWIYEGGDSGRLDFQLDDGRWGAVCKGGFDDDATDVACDSWVCARVSVCACVCVHTCVCVCRVIGRGFPGASGNPLNF